MKEQRPEGSEESEDQLIDLNKEPDERKRKRSESKAEKENGKVYGLSPQATGRVLRSMTVTDGEEQMLERKIVKVNVEDACEVFESMKKEKRRGRPPKGEIVKRADLDEIEVSTVSVQRKKMKGRRGRPPKVEGKCAVSSLSISEKSDKVMTDEDNMDIVETADQEESKVTNISPMGKKVKGKRGRPPKAKSICGDSPSSFRKKEESVMVDSEEQVMNGKIVKMEDEGENESLNISVGGRKMKARRGRPPKVKSYSSEVPVMLKKKKKKGRLGRPPMIKDKSGVSSSCSMKEDEIMERKEFDKSTNRAGYGMPRVTRGMWGAPKVENGYLETVVKNKRVSINGDGGKAEKMSAGKRLKVDSVNDGSIRPEKNTVVCAEGKEMGLREQKQLLRDQIVDMLFKAGWKIEYRQRQSKDYQDAVYVDRQGRTYWSVTKAYKKLKETIDKGNASEIDISAFSPIPDETLSLLFRITTKGKKSGKSKNSAGQTKKKASKVKSGDGRTKSKSYRGKRTLLARRPGDGSDKDGYELYEGKRSLFSWMIDLGTVSLGGKVKYKRGRTKKMVLNGNVTKDGICCDCCNTTHTIQDFESHAKSDLGQPYQNIYLETGNTLFQCMVDSWRKHVEINSIRFVQIDVDGDDPNDDTCNICGDGGNLICCDSCPSTFHHGCLDIKIPSGDWHCIYCSCKFCGLAGESTSTSDDSHGLLSDMFMCSLCEEKFHVNCTEENVDEDFDHEDPSFCGNECQKIFKQLQVLLGVRHGLEEGFFYTVLHHHEVSSEASIDGDSSKIESNSKLAVAFTVMDECFEPIVDERSGTNMIQNVVYNCGSNIRRLNYGGFYTIILEKGDEFVAAASIRIHGSQLAEMPFIGTRYAYRRQGMCKRLLTAIETVLSSLGVEKLVIPAISDLNETWKNVFGFSPLEESKRREMKHMSLMVFPKTNMLQKPLVAYGSTKTKLDSAVVECTEDVNPTSDFNTLTDVKLQNQGETAAVESNARPLDAPAMESIEVEQNTQKEKIRGDNKLQNHGEAAVESIESIEVEQADVKLQTRSEAVESNASLVDAPAIESVEIQHDGASEVEIHDNGKTNEVDLGDDKEFDTKISSTDLRESSDKESVIKISLENCLGESSDKGSDVNISPGNLGESSENRNCRNTSQDENILLYLNCSSEEPKSCVNGFLSVIGNGKCDEHDISGVEGDGGEGKLERHECCISKKEVVC